MPDKYADKAAPDPGLHALFGGTFDPIHFGHLHPVEALAQQVGLQQVILLPNRVPPHRPQPEASAQQRLKMVQLAIEGNPLFRVDDRELQRTTPSYTIDTLESLRAESGLNYHSPLLSVRIHCLLCINGTVGNPCWRFVICWYVLAPAMPKHWIHRRFNAGWSNIRSRRQKN